MLNTTVPSNMATAYARSYNIPQYGEGNSHMWLADFAATTLPQPQQAIDAPDDRSATAVRKVASVTRYENIGSTVDLLCMYRSSGSSLGDS